MTKKAKTPEPGLFRYSNRMATARYDYSLTEMRMIASLLYLIDQHRKSGEDTFSDRIGTIYNWEDNQKIVKFPIKLILGDEYREGEEHKNYRYAMERIQALAKKPMSIYHSVDKWKEIYPFVFTEKKEGEGFLTAAISPTIWKMLEQLTSGYTLLKIDNILMMRSKYTIRMHQMVEGMYRPLTFKISTLKEMFKLEKKYSENKDFIKYVIESAKNELNELNLTTFDYRKESRSEEKKKGRPETTHITFIPVMQDMFDEPTVRRMLSTKGLRSLFLEDELTALLHAGFRQDEIKANVFDIYKFSRMNDLVNEMLILEKVSKEKNNPKGWIISEMKKMNELLENALNTPQKKQSTKKKKQITDENQANDI